MQWCEQRSNLRQAERRVVVVAGLGLSDLALLFAERFLVGRNASGDFIAGKPGLNGFQLCGGSQRRRRLSEEFLRSISGSVETLFKNAIDSELHLSLQCCDAALLTFPSQADLFVKVIALLVREIKRQLRCCRFDFQLDPFEFRSLCDQLLSQQWIVQACEDLVGFDFVQDLPTWSFGRFAQQTIRAGGHDGADCFDFADRVRSGYILMPHPQHYTHQPDKGKRRKESLP